CVSFERDVGSVYAPWRCGNRLRPAADDQAAAHAHAVAARGAVVPARGRPVRSVYLCGRAADPEACRRKGRGLRAHLAQHAAGARVGLSPRLTRASPSGIRKPHMPLDSRDRLIVALDLPGLRDAQQMVERLGDSVSFYKIGYQLAFASGLAFVDELIRGG